MMTFKGISFGPDFHTKKNQQFRTAQEYVDSEVLRRAEPYVPKQSGNLRESGHKGTKIGSGVVKYTAPYARPRYFKGKAKRGLQGKYWFSRMKADHKEKIFSGAKGKFK